MSMESKIFDKDISIIMQGPIYKENIIEYANNCMLWREKFPESEIVSVVSTSDILEKDTTGNILLSKFLKCDMIVSASLEKIKEISDKFILLGSGIPLYALKNDTGFCHGNFQIEAAQAGLKEAGRKYVLRIRSDAVFFDKRFLAFYERNYLKPRGRYSIFKQRVMIANTFTINPYAMERLPFHWSDWFHLGLLEDVRKLWDVPNISVSNSIFYKIKSFLPYSNAFERRFFHRMGVEQHVNYSFFKKHIPDLKLEFHNDISSRETSIEILKDNFVICNAYEIGFFFEKYKADAENRRFRRWCIGNDIWNELITCEPRNYKEKLHFTKDEVLFDKNKPFPRTYEAKDLFSKTGALINQHICITNHEIYHDDNFYDGTLVFGPHVMIPPGRYEAKFFFSHIQAVSGELILRTSLDHSAIQLADKRIKIKGEFIEKEFTLYFENKFLNAKNFETIVETHNVEDIEFHKVVIYRTGDCQAYNYNNKNVSRRNLNVYELSPALRGVIVLMSKFMGSRKRNKLFNNTSGFFEDSNSIINKFVKIFYDRENKSKR